MVSLMDVTLSVSWEWPLAARPFVMGAHVPAYRLPFCNERGKQTNISENAFLGFQKELFFGLKFALLYVCMSENLEINFVKGV